MKRIFSILLLSACVVNVWAQTDNVFPTTGNVGIGTVNPRAALDVSKYISNGTLGTVLGRLPEGDIIGSGTFLGKQGYNTNIIGGKSFSIVHNFYGETNSSINFHRGGDKIGGFISFNTYSNVERMRIDASGNVGIGTEDPRAKLDVSGNMLLRSGLNNSSPRPSLSTQSISGEIRAYSIGGYAYDDGLLRLSAGAGSTPSIMSYIDIISYSTIPDMDQNIVFGTAGQEKMRIHKNGNIGIGTANPSDKLSVNGNIRAREIKVEATNWPDYVFEEGYKVETLEGLESYIKANKHLPEMPSAKEVEANGVELGEMNKLLLKK